VVVSDDTEYDRWPAESIAHAGLGLCWKAAHVAATRDRFTHIVRARSWDDAFSQLAAIAQTRKLAEVQYAGHGSNGGAHLGTSELNVQTLDELLQQPRGVGGALAALVAARPFPDASACVQPIWWFRTCSTLGGDSGRRFAQRLSEVFAADCEPLAGDSACADATRDAAGSPEPRLPQVPSYASASALGRPARRCFLRVAGHTQVISNPNPLLQPGLVVFDPLAAAAPSWRDDEGDAITALTWSPELLHPIYTM
jgi:hypothetical protein